MGQQQQKRELSDFISQCFLDIYCFFHIVNSLILVEAWALQLARLSVEIEI